MSARLLLSSLNRRYAWVPIPVLLTLIIGLWVANLQGVYESRFWMLFFNIFFTFLAGLCICVLSARGFVQTGRPGLLMFSCGALVWGVTSLSAAAIVVNHLNASVTVHNVGILGAALCHLAGLLWHGRLTRPGRWLVAGYAGALVAAAVIFGAAMAGLTPVFFVQGAGGTLIRHVVLWLSVVVFGLVAWQMWARSSQPANAFYYWYGLGLGLVATGLVGVALLTVQGGVLGWANRLTQYLGSAYLFVAALAAVRETGTWRISLAAIEEAWSEGELLAYFRQQPLAKQLARYAGAVVLVALSFGLRVEITACFGPGLPTYSIFYPAIMVAALLGGFGPGLVATALTTLMVGYWILLPVGQFYIASPVDRLGLVMFIGVGLFISVVAELYRRNRAKVTTLELAAAVREKDELLRRHAELMDHASEALIVRELGGAIRFWNEGAATLYGWSAAEAIGQRTNILLKTEGVPVAEKDKQLAQTGHWDGELVHTARDGRRIVVESRQTATRGADGQLMVLESDRDITARKAAAGALQASEQRIQQALNISHSFTFEWHPATDAVARSDSSATILKLTGATVCNDTGQNFFKSIHPDDRAKFIQTLNGLTPAADSYTTEYRVVCGDGTVTVLEETGQGTFNAAGKLERLVGVSTDITASKQAAEALRLSEQKFAFAFANNPAAIALTRLDDGKFLDVNETWVTMTGYKRAEVIGRSARELPIWPTTAAAARYVRELRDKGSLHGWEQEFRNKSGGTYVAQLSAQLLTVHGEPVILTTLVDITARKQAEDALAASEARLQFALETIQTGAWDLDLVDHTAHRSLEHDRVFGYAELLPAWTYEMFLEHVVPEDRAMVDSKFQHAVKTKGDWNIECRIRRADGAERWILAAGRHCPDAAGVVRRMAGIVQDITARKEAEEQIKAALTEKEVLLKEIHHRVKNNLQVIASLVSLQSDNLTDPKLLEVFGDVRDRVRTMALVHESLYQTGDLARLNLADYATGLMSHLWHAHRTVAGNVQLKLAITSVILPIDLAVPCGLIMNELTSNALKHAFPAGRRGEITVTADHDPKSDTVCLCVRDNGIGLPAGWDWQQSNSLGMRLVHMLAGQLSGTVTTGPGPGAEFRVTFPSQNGAH